MKKKLFSTIMCVLMIMCYIPSVAFAEGGTDETTYADDGTTFEETNTTYVAEVDGKGCGTIFVAVNRAYESENHTVKLLEDVTLNSRLYLNQDVIIDLNGHKITNGEVLLTNFSLIEIAHGANVSIVGDAEGSEIVDTRNNEDGIYSTVPAIHVYGALTVSGNALSISAGENQIAIKVDEDNGKQGTLTVEGGTFTSTQAIQNYCGIATINDGTFNGIVSNYASKYGISGYSAAGDLTINGGTFNGKVFSAERNLIKWPEKSAKVSINGGTFNAGIAECYATSMKLEDHNETKPDDCNYESIVTVAGGTFSTDPSAYLADGYSVVGKIDGTWGIVGSVAISGASVTAQAGETIDVDVNVDENTGIAQLMFDIEYDTTVLELTAVTNGEVFETKYFEGLDEDYESGDDVTLVWDRSTPAEEDSTGNIAKTGKLVTLTFRVKDGTKPQKCEIEFNNIEAWDYGLDSVKSSASKATVKIVLYGDVNNDGVVNSADTTNLTRYVAKWRSYTADKLNLDAADLDADGRITLKDVAILRCHVAEWDEYLTLPYKG